MSLTRASPALYSSCSWPHPGHGTTDARVASLPVVTRDARPAFAPLSLFEEVIWDYRSTDHRPRRHPLAPVRANLTARGLPDARAVAAMRDGRRVRYAGLVICRQQPGTAQGITGTLRPQQGVVHLVADRLWKPQVGRAPASTPSRDFH